MIDTIEENDNSLLEYLITGLVILFFGGLYYFLNAGSSINSDALPKAAFTDSTSLAKPATVSFSGPSSLALTDNFSTAKTTTPPNAETVHNTKANTPVILAVDPKPDVVEATEVNVADTDDNSAAEMLKLQAEKIALLEAQKNQLESDVAALKDDRAILIETTTELLRKADEELLPPQEGTTNESLKQTNESEVEIAEPDFESRLRQTLQNKIINRPIIFDNVFFESGKAEPTKQSQNQINTTAALLNTHKDVNILIKGHSDDIGDTKSNTLLSLTRSDFMKKALIKLGIDARRIKVQGVGSLEPIAPNNSAEGRNTNRRIELILID